MKLQSPAASRNKDPIAEVLRHWLPPQGLVLEVASGSGEHALAFARRFPGLQWQPSDADPVALASIQSWQAEGCPANLLPPVRLDVTGEWPLTAADAVLAINLVHITPWEASLALLDGAARLLPAGGPLILYGPWRVRGQPVAPSNLAFEAQLKARDRRFGLREVEQFAEEARVRGLELERQEIMPANNRMLLLRRAG